MGRVSVQKGKIVRSLSRFFVFLVFLQLIPGICQASAIILTNASPDHTVSSGSEETIYGTSTSNRITIESGARAELVHFSGNNHIQVLSSSDFFLVSRYGSVVYFEGSEGTFFKIPATESIQNISFTDRTFVLGVFDNTVMLDDQVIGSDKAPLLKSALALNYTFTIDNPEDGILTVLIQMENISSEPLTFSRFLPYEENPGITVQSVTDESGSNLTYSIETDRLDIYRAVEKYSISPIMDSGMVFFQYEIDLSHLPLDPIGGHGYWILDSHYGAVEAQIALLQPTSNAEQYRCNIDYSLPPQWETLGRFENTETGLEANTNDVVSIWNFNNYEVFEFFLWGPLLFGQFDTFSKTIGGVDVMVSFLDGIGTEQETISNNIFTVFEYFSYHLGRLNEPALYETPIKYIYCFLSENNGKYAHSGDHILGQYTLFPDIQSTGTLYMRGVAHTMAHTWFSHYGLSVNAPETVLDEEEIIQFYAVKALEETGIWDSDEVNTHLTGWLNDYQNFIVGTQYDVPFQPPTWSEFPNTSLPSLYSYGIHNIIWYEKAPLILWLLDDLMKEETANASSLHDIWPLYSGNFLNPLTYTELLSRCNYLTGRDFSLFFDQYIWGNTEIPYYSDNGTLTVDQASLSELPTLSLEEVFKLGMKFGNTGHDSDGDGLSDEFEAVIGTDPYMADTDDDGLNDREEFGVVADGNYGEYGIEDSIVFSRNERVSDQSNGTEIKEVGVIQIEDENKTQYLYIHLSTWDGFINEAAWYEFFIWVGDSIQPYQFRYENGNSMLFFCQEPEGCMDIAEGKLGSNDDLILEVKIPFDMIEKPSAIQFQAAIRYGGDPMSEFGLDTADSSPNCHVNLKTKVFVTDPLNPDSDADGVSDGAEVINGTDPMDYSI